MLAIIQTRGTMKTRRLTLFRLMAVLAATAALSSACTLTDFLSSLCSTSALMVTKAEDTNDGLCLGTDCSLREAIVTSNSCPGTQTIELPDATYSLTLTGADEEAAALGDLDITDNAIIAGEGNAIIDGNAIDRIFDVKPGKALTLSGLVLQNGQTPLFGSAIANQGILSVDRVILQNNHQTDQSGNGGAIFTYGLDSSLDISNSAVVNNWAAIDAAGLYNVEGNMTLENVTISGNHGYAVANLQGGLTQIRFSTIADNFAAYEIWNPGIGSAVEISNSIIAGRTTEGNCFQPVTSGGFNIDSAVSGTANSCGLTAPSDLTNTDPRLLKLTANGGETLTRALDSDSPAINSADSAACNASDQRGITRPQGAKCDRGAFELQNPPPPATPTPIPTKSRQPAETATPNPNAKGHSAVSLTFNASSNCRKGPGTGYLRVTAFDVGATVDVIGQNNLKTWGLIQIPASGETCWAAFSLGTLSGPSASLTIYPTPPIPADPVSFNDSSACSADQRTVKLTWAVQPDTTGYNLYRNGKILTTVSALSSSYEDNVPPNKDYFYELEAFNANGFSARVNTTTLACH